MLSYFFNAEVKENSSTTWYRRFVSFCFSFVKIQSCFLGASAAGGSFLGAGNIDAPGGSGKYCSFVILFSFDLFYFILFINF